MTECVQQLYIEMGCELVFSSNRPIQGRAKIYSQAVSNFVSCFAILGDDNLMQPASSTSATCMYYFVEGPLLPFMR